MEKQNNKIAYIPIIKAIACFAIVILHSFYGADGSFEKTTAEHNISLIIKNLMNWAVPCFVMVSGALLLDPARKAGIKKIFTKYLSRMVIALIVFSVLFRLFDMILFKEGFSFTFITDGLLNAWQSKSWSHMWYIYMMISIYLMLPVYKKITQTAEKNDIVYMVCLYGIFQAIVPFIETTLDTKIPIYIFVSTVYPFYFFCGYALHKEYIKLNAVISAIITIISAVLIAFLTYYAENSGKETLETALSAYTCPLYGLLAIGVYSLFQNIKNEKNNIFFKFINSVSNCSFGIYLIHMAVLKLILVGFKFNPYENGGIITIFAISVVVFIITYIVVWILRKIPFVKKIV